MDENMIATSVQPPEDAPIHTSHLLNIKVSPELGDTLKSYWQIPFRVQTQEESEEKFWQRAAEAQSRGDILCGRPTWIPVRVRETFKHTVRTVTRLHPVVQPISTTPFEYTMASPDQFLACMHAIGVPLTRYEIMMRQGVITGEQWDGRAKRSNRWYLRLYFNPPDPMFVDLDDPPIEIDPRHKEVINAILSLVYQELFIYDNTEEGEGITYNFRTPLPVNPAGWSNSIKTYGVLRVATFPPEFEVDGDHDVFVVEEGCLRPSVDNDRVAAVKEFLRPRTTMERRFEESVDVVRQALAGSRKILLGFSTGAKKAKRAQGLLARAARGDFALDEAGTEYLKSVVAGNPRGSQQLLIQLPTYVDPEFFVNGLKNNIGGGVLRLPQE